MEQRPRVVFLIPIASAQSVPDWHLACFQFRQTSRSVFNSRNRNFRVAAGGQEAPDFELPHDCRFQFISVNHPSPSHTQGTYDEKIPDKRIKIEADWDHAKKAWSPEYVMKVDWDDYQRKTGGLARLGQG